MSGILVSAVKLCDDTENFGHHSSQKKRSYKDLRVCFKWGQLHAQYFLVYLFQLLYMFRATMCPSSGDVYCIYTTLVFFALYGWLSGLLVGMRLISTSIPDSR